MDTYLMTFVVEGHFQSADMYCAISFIEHCSFFVNNIVP